MWANIVIIIIGLNMFLVPINIPTFYFRPSKIFLQLLVPKKFFIFTFGPCFKVENNQFPIKLEIGNLIDKLEENSALEPHRLNIDGS